VALKELGLFFASPVAWLFLGAFAATTLFVFFWIESFFARNIADVRPLFEWIPVLLVFLSAALTMRMWSDERRSGTLEYIHIQPAPLWHFALGKFVACFLLLLLALVSTLPLPVTVALIADLDCGPVIAGYLASSLLGAAYLAIGLFVSSRTDNAIVSLIGSVALCGLLYIAGSTVLTAFFDDRTGELLRLLGTGARFESITRGVIDARDLFYYASLVVAFLALGVYGLERERWARESAARHRHWRTGIALLLANLLLANLWLGQITNLRMDITEGRQFSISQQSTDFLGELQEPLLIRGYFSRKTHPLLAPLVPQLRDLVREYEAAGNGMVRVEFIDPAEHPELEQQANRQYGISATPFQIADRHQSALVSAYFNLLVSYGGEHRSLSFADLIEVRTAASGSSEVILRNPEYDITHAIKQVLSDYRTGGNLFDGIDAPVELIGYVSPPDRLPEPLRAYRDSIVPQLELAAARSQGKFSFRLLDPDADDGRLARSIGEEWGFKSMVTAPGDSVHFWFYLTLADADRVVQLPMEDFEPTSFRLLLDSGLKRFASGFNRSVALVLPEVNAQMAQYHLGGPTFTNLERLVSQDYSILLEDLSDGTVSPEADLLAVVAPQQLDELSVLALDQFLMRGGTLVLVTSPFTAEVSDGQLRLQDWHSGLGPWLAHHGITIGDSLVLDTRNAPFPVPVTRRSGEYEFREVQMVDYPYFLDLRPPGLAADHPITANLPQVTMAWASPVLAEPGEGRRIRVLLRASREAWLSDAMDVMPRVDAQGQGGFRPPLQADQLTAGLPPSGPPQLGLVVQGRFPSFFSRLPDSAAERDYNGQRSLLQRSPESARIVILASNDFMDDQVLGGVVAAAGTQYLGPLELFMNTLDWALQDDQLLQIRSRAHFNRTLPPMERQAQLLIEYFNYGLAVAWLLLLAVASWLRSILRRRHFARELAA
jgi:ABC-2 type transport system permease protein